ncbi:AAA family ATPase [uncultured Pseudoalteromonas sp.]|uniref:AAA family ATPase n=1 Tax=uncultured Pseudoalteromonas sp. TaxID=114053 RepID=UPI0025980CF7|nr:AAA family ATPase [uncultured Pseudoalteromonas sp.]
MNTANNTQAIKSVSNVITRESARQMSNEQLVKLLDLKNPVIEDIVYGDPRWSEMEEVDAGEVFYPHVPKGVIKVLRPKHRHPKCIKANPSYIPQRDVLRPLLAWWCANTRKLSMFMFGETGTGKTEMLLWFADRLNWPVTLTSVNESLRPEKVQGSYILYGDKTPYRYGSLAKAMKYGWVQIMDECDKGSGDLLSKLHTPAEYKPWELDDTGEIIEPHTNFRFCATGNTNGGGDMTGRYHTSQRLDEAFRRRFAFIECDYPSEAIEDSIISASYPSISKKTRHKMVKLAKEMRQALRAPQLEANALTPEELSKLQLPTERLSCAFSTRVLVAWADYMNIFGAKSVPIKESFDFVFGNSLDDDDRPAVMSICQRIFGESFNQPDEGDTNMGK